MLLARSHPGGGVERFGYSARGLIAHTNRLGLTTFYARDEAGRRSFETNANWEITQFQLDPSGNTTNLIDGKDQSTLWNYDVYGRMTTKVDNLGQELFLYAYDADNRLTARTSLAKGTTQYFYDAVGNPTNVVYPTNTALVLVYDALNRLTTMVDGVGTNCYTYDTANQLLSEGGLWQDDTVSYKYNNRLRTGLSLAQPDSGPWTQSYGYDPAKRLTSVASPAGSFSYAYDALRSTLPAILTLPNGAHITTTYDSVARLLSTTLSSSGLSTINSHTYQLNSAGQRTQQVFTAGNYINYTYDNAGQLKTARGKDNQPIGLYDRLQEQFGYAYDPAGNLNSRTNNALVESFAVNSLNELTTETNSGTLTVAGTTTSQASSVTVNNSNAALYLDYTFASTNQTFVNGNNTFTAIAQDGYGRKDTNVITCHLNATNSFGYDLNGDLLTDTNRNFAYDDENQLVSVWVTNVWRSDFQYDGKMRRRVRVESTWSGSAWATNTIVRYIYDGNVVIQERWLAPGLSTVVPQNAITYTRGRGLSGKMQGAGGIGGLLARTYNGQLTAGLSSAHAFYHCDANGNISALINTNQAVVAKYQYDPFGNILSQSGALADANLYRFSSKEYHSNSGTICYLYRFYDPNLQRSINRDPREELGFAACTRVLSPPLGTERNLYTFVGNSPVEKLDPLGLSPCTDKCRNDFANDVSKIQQETAKCLAWGYSFCTARRGGLRCFFWASVGCGDKAALQEVAAASRLAGCLSGCESSCSHQPPEPHLSWWQ